MKIIKRLSSEQDAKIKSCNELFKSLIPDICVLMEKTRHTYGYSQTNFAALLGLSLSQYIRFLQKGSNIPSISAIFKFCYIFGYDLQTLEKTAVTSKELDDTLLELAASFGAVPDKTMQQIIDVVNQAKGMRVADKTRTIAALSNYVNIRTQFYKELEKKNFDDISLDNKDAAGSTNDIADDTEDVVTDEIDSLQ